MPRKSLAPAFVVVNYTTTIGTVVFPHTMTIPVNVVAWSGATTQLVLKNATSVQWDTAITNMLNTIMALYHTSSVFPLWELWRQDTATSDPSLQATFASGMAGTSGGPTIQACGANFAFRSTEDSAYRLLLIESNQAVDQRKAYSALSATQKAPIDFLLGNTSPVYARSNAYLQTFGIFTSKAYDKVRDKRLGL
jgi:hypothetical protein